MLDTSFVVIMALAACKGWFINWIDIEQDGERYMSPVP